MTSRKKYMDKRWNLDDLHKSYDEAYNNLEHAHQEAKAFKDKYSQVLATLPQDDSLIDQAIAAYEAIEEKVGRTCCYAALKRYTSLKDEHISQHFTKIQQKAAEINKELVFFTLAINKLPTVPVSKRYQNWIQQVRSVKDYELSEELEAFLCDKNLTAHSAWVKLFDDMQASTAFDFQGETVGIAKVLEGMSSHDGQVRKAAAQSLHAGLQKNLKWTAFIYNTLMQDKMLTDRKRGLTFPEQSRHLANQVEPEVVDALCDSVKKNYAKLAHRWYKMKAKFLGKEKLEYWDRNAPLFTDDDVKISYEDGQKIVEKAYRDFSPVMADIVKQFFDNPWIDVPAEDDKYSGAFSMATVPCAHPYILLNYQDKVRDVATLAHELGHSIHQYLARGVGALQQDAPLTIAETASVFGEMLTFKALKNSGQYNVRALLASKIDDMLNTVVRQIAFYEFEKRVHQHRQEKGELTVEDFANYWVQTQKEALGDGVNLDPICHNFWAYVNHFFHAAFYVYAYAFGDCLVNSLYMVYEETPNKAEFEKNYVEFLKAGGSKSYSELLKPFGLDPSDPHFWDKGLSLITKMMDELEAH